jgi:uncharacterized membrane protein YhaH (DUF805 family)
MLEDLKSFYAGMFSYKGEATAREVYNPLIASAALGILFAIANSFAEGYVAKWIVGFITVVWAIATVLAFVAISVRRVGWLHRSVVGLVFAALCVVGGVSLWVYGFGVPWLLGGVLRLPWACSGVGVAAFGVVVWLATVLPSTRANRSERASHKQANGRTPRHGAHSESNKGRHADGSAVKDEVQGVAQGESTGGIHEAAQATAQQGIQQAADKPSQAATQQGIQQSASNQPAASSTQSVSHESSYAYTNSGLLTL